MFYGYKGFLVDDAALELPINTTMMAGKLNESVVFERLVEGFEERYGIDDLQAALAGAGFNGQGNLEFCQEHLDCPLLTAINPRRLSPLQTIKREIKQIFVEHAEAIDTPHDALELLPRVQLSEYGVDAGGLEETYISQAIKNGCTGISAPVYSVSAPVYSGCFPGWSRSPALIGSAPVRKTTS